MYHNCKVQLMQCRYRPVCSRNFSQSQSTHKLCTLYVYIRKLKMNSTVGSSILHTQELPSHSEIKTPQ